MPPTWMLLALRLYEGDTITLERSSRANAAIALSSYATGRGMPVLAAIRIEKRFDAAVVFVYGDSWFDAGYLCRASATMPAPR